MFLVVLLLIVAPLVELYVIIQVAQVIGGWQTIALLVVEGMLGAWLLKRQGLSIVHKVDRAVAEGRVPSKELVDGLLVVVAGALMLAPGFISDLIGFLLLIPVTRSLARRPIVKRFATGGYTRWFGSTGRVSGSRFVGTFWASDVYDASGRESASASTSNQIPGLDP